MPQRYIKKILDARVYDVAIETPLTEARSLSKRFGNNILLKREDLQPVFSFKIRGAYNRIAQLSEEQKAKGVICASAGNHATSRRFNLIRIHVFISRACFRTIRLGGANFLVN